MGNAGFGGSFDPIVQYEKWEIHPVFPHFPYFRLCQNLSPNLLSPLCGVALNLKHYSMKMRKNQYGARNLYVKKWLNQSRKCINREMGNANSPSNSFLEKCLWGCAFVLPKQRAKLLTWHAGRASIQHNGNYVVFFPFLRNQLFQQLTSD